MTELMYNTLMEYIDDLETMHLADSWTCLTLRQAIKNNENTAIMLYNYYGLRGDHDAV